MHNFLMVIVVALIGWMSSAQAQPLTVDPESIVPLPRTFDMDMPAPDVPPEMARFYGAWVGTWADDRHILVVERVKPDGHAKVVFARADSAFYGMNREHRSSILAHSDGWRSRLHWRLAGVWPDLKTAAALVATTSVLLRHRRVEGSLSLPTGLSGLSLPSWRHSVNPSHTYAI
jgi:hypothetical protein